MKVLLPHDGSEASQQTLVWASQFFDKASTEFYVLAVVYSPTASLPVMEHQIEWAIHMLPEAEQHLSQKGFKVQSEYRVGQPSEEICSFANEKDIDLVVVGSHGKTGLSKMLLGSISSEVLKKSDKPVIVYKNKVENAVNV